MATRREYAEWCLKLIEGNDEIIDDVYASLYEDGFINESQVWEEEEE